jgi:SAM-dependent methyltransferase
VPEQCHNCGGWDLPVFYEVRDIPVHSVLLMRSYEEAVEYPRRDLRLGFCTDCGFIQNLLFQPRVHEYSTRYEETQGFSPTFNDFMRELCQRLVDRYDLHGKTILEIGCGKGEFLSMLCEIGDNRGVGIDPGYVPERTAPSTGSKVEFIQDFYSEKYAHLQADFVCCRHTLEHIQLTRQFLGIIRRSLGGRGDAVVCVEVPDTARVLKEEAFWDIYYEHCSYFTAGSIGRLFRSSGFDLLNLEKDFGSQYLLIEGRLRNGSPASRLELENDLDDVAADVERFRREVPQKLDGWRERLRRAAAKGKQVVIWGSGSKAVSFLTTLGADANSVWVTDINPHRHDTYMPGTGHRIVSPGRLMDLAPDLVIAMNPLYLGEIRRDLREMGLEPALMAV